MQVVEIGSTHQLIVAKKSHLIKSWPSKFSNFPLINIPKTFNTSLLDCLLISLKLITQQTYYVRRQSIKRIRKSAISNWTRIKKFKKIISRQKLTPLEILSIFLFFTSKRFVSLWEIKNKYEKWLFANLGCFWKSAVQFEMLYIWIWNEP